MAATEAKEAPPKEVIVEENSAPLNCKKWVLKVSIHCEGCKRKVKKVLHSVEGVYETDIDLKQQKAIVTVKGNVHPETLIRKLVKTGRPAELWPEKEKKQSKSKNKKEKQSDQESSEESNHGEDKEKQAVKAEVHHVQDPSKHSEGGCASKNGEGTSKAGGQVKEQKPEAKQTVTSPAGSQPPVAEKNSIGCENENGAEKSGGGGGGGGGSGGSGSGSGGKKKKKKGHKVSVKIDEGVEHPGDAPPSTGSPIHAHAQAHAQAPHGHGQNPYPANHSSPPQHVYHQSSPQHYYSQPQHYYSQPQPVYATSYSMAHPTSSHGTSYYASPTPPNSQVYMHETEYETDHPPPSDYYYGSYQPHPSDSFELFSDENPNGCSIM